MNTDSYKNLHESAKDAAERAANIERTSPLGVALSQDFLESTRTDLKSQGFKVEARDNKYKETPRKKVAAHLEDPENSGGGPNVLQHPLLPNAEGMADDFILPDSELTDSPQNNPELTNQLKNKLTLSQKQTLKANNELKQRQRLQQPPPRPKPTPF